MRRTFVYGTIHAKHILPLYIIISILITATYDDDTGFDQHFMSHDAYDAKQ